MLLQAPRLLRIFLFMAPHSSPLPERSQTILSGPGFVQRYPVRTRHLACSLQEYPRLPTMANRNPIHPSGSPTYIAPPHRRHSSTSANSTGRRFPCSRPGAQPFRVAAPSPLLPLPPRLFHTRLQQPPRQTSPSRAHRMSLSLALCCRVWIPSFLPRQGSSPWS